MDKLRSWTPLWALVFLEFRKLSLSDILVTGRGVFQTEQLGKGDTPG